MSNNDLLLKITGNIGDFNKDEMETDVKLLPLDYTDGEMEKIQEHIGEIMQTMRTAILREYNDYRIEKFKENCESCDDKEDCTKYKLLLNIMELEKIFKN